MPAPRPVTVHDVARRAGVGKTTVSNALTGNGRLSAATRELVMQAADDLGYTPNRAARQLRTGATGVIGVYLPEAPTASDYYMRFVFGALEHAAGHDVDVAVITTAPGSNRERLPQTDGVIICDPLEGDPYTERLLRSALPTVTCERAVGGAQPAGVVWADHGAATIALLTHMAGAGATRIALVLPAERGDWSRQVATAYRAWCASAGAPTVIEHTSWVPSTTELEDAFDAAVRRQPELDGLLCGPVDTAALILPGLRTRGYTIGVDLLLACATDSTALQLCDPPVTAIDLAPRDAGDRCAELLLGIISGGVGRGTSVQLEPRVVARASTRGRR